MNIRRLPGHSHPDEDDHLTVDNTYMVLITDLKTIKKICEGQQRLIGLFWFYCPARGDSRYLYLKYSWGVCSRRHLSITINGRIIRHYRVLKSSIVRWIDGWMYGNWTKKSIITGSQLDRHRVSVIYRKWGNNYIVPLLFLVSLSLYCILFLFEKNVLLYNSAAPV